MSVLPRYLMLDHKLDRLPRAALRALQSERLRNMVRYCYDATPFWRRKFDEAKLKPGDIASIDDLARIPFCTKSELQEDQRLHPPFGSYVGIARSHWAHFASTSGTTGQPLRRVLSERDWVMMVDRFRRNPTVVPGDIVFLLGPSDGLIGPSVSSASAQAQGAMVVQAGLYDTRTKIRMIRDLKPAVISGTTSYLLHVLEVAAELDIDLAKLGIRTVAAFGEPGGAQEATRERLRAGWGARIADGYGMTELFPLGGNCPHSPDLHIASDMAAVQIVDPESGEVLPPGESGEVVLTNLVGDSQPLLRYRSRDISRLAGDEACACGFTGARLAGSIQARVDDMIWFRGVNVYPAAIEAAVRGIEGLATEYQIEISGEGALPVMKVRAEAGRSGLAESELAGLCEQLGAALKQMIRVSAGVEILPQGTLPRPDGRKKMRRVVDLRRG